MNFYIKNININLIQLNIPQIAFQVDLVCPRNNKLNIYRPFFRFLYSLYFHPLIFFFY